MIFLSFNKIEKLIQFLSDLMILVAMAKFLYEQKPFTRKFNVKCSVIDGNM